MYGVAYVWQKARGRQKTHDGKQMIWFTQLSAISIRRLTTVNIFRAGPNPGLVKIKNVRKKSAAQKNDFILLDDIPVYRLNWLWSFEPDCSPSLHRSDWFVAKLISE